MNFHKMILIGLLLQFFDFWIGGFDILPDTIGLLLIGYAFTQVKAPYAKLGIGATVPLVLAAFAEIFEPALFTSSAGLLLQIAAASVQLLTIVQIACIFTVSNYIVQYEASLFPTVWIGLLVMMELLTAIGRHLNVQTYEHTVYALSFLLLSLYLYFFYFLWERKKKETALVKERARTN